MDALWKLVDEWNSVESHERRLCAEQLAKALLKERLKEHRGSQRKPEDMLGLAELWMLKEQAF